MNHQPVEIAAEKLAAINPSTGTKLFLGGIWGAVESGQTWLATDGKRTVISADSMAVIYVLTSAQNPGQSNKIFGQSAQGFRGEVTTYPLAEAGRRAAPMARLAEIEMQVLVGIAAASSGAGFAAVIGTDVLDFCLRNHDNFGPWSRALGACVAARAVLKRHAPTLYDKLIDATLIAAAGGLAESARNIPEAAANDPKLIGRTVGAIAGKLGKKTMAARLSALGVIWILLSTLATKALAAVPGALKLSLEERTRTAEAIIAELKRSGITLTEADARAIVEEIAARPQELRAALEQLRSAFANIRAE